MCVPRQRNTDLSDIQLTVIPLFVRLSEMSDTSHQAVCDPGRYTDLSDFLLTVILLLDRLSEMSDTRLFVTPDQRYSDLSDILLTVILYLSGCQNGCL